MRGPWWAIVAFVLVAPPASSAAPVVIDFEELSDLDAVTTQYVGLTFSGAIVLTAGISLNEFDFPPRSGVNVISDNGAPIEIQFASPVLSFGGFFTYATPLTLTAFDAGHNVVATVASLFSSNLALDSGAAPNELLELVAASGIWALTITGDPFGGSFVLDDATITPLETTVVPEPGTISLLLLGAGSLGRRTVRLRLSGKAACG